MQFSSARVFLYLFCFNRTKRLQVITGSIGISCVLTKPKKNKLKVVRSIRYNKSQISVLNRNQKNRKTIGSLLTKRVDHSKLTEKNMKSIKRLLYIENALVLRQNL